MLKNRVVMERELTVVFSYFSPEVIDLIVGDDTVWEQDPLETLAERGQLMAFEHDGFWQPMDTLRDKILLNDLWANNNAPWKSWIKMFNNVYSKKKVLVTGHTGFKGTWVNNLVAEVRRPGMWDFK